MVFSISDIMSKNPPKPPDPLIPWQSVRAFALNIGELKDREVTVALQMLRDRGTNICLYEDPKGGGIPTPDWIDWTGFANA